MLLKKQSEANKKKLCGLFFYGWGSIASRLEPLRGGSLLFTIKFPEIPDSRNITSKHPVIKRNIP